MQTGATTVKNSMEVCQKIKKLPYDPLIALLGIYPNVKNKYEKIYALLCLLQHYLL